MSAPSPRFTPSPLAVYTRLDETEAVLLHLKTKRYYSLNETGIFIWDLLEQAHDPEEIAAALSDTYDVDPPGARDYLRLFLDDLRGEGLVEEAG